jgi:outer membrane protein assembly factor BamB
VAGGTVYIGSDNGTVYALDAVTGSLRWARTTADSVDSSPAVAGGTVYVYGVDGNDDGTVYALDAATGHLRWAYTTVGVPGSIGGCCTTLGAMETSPAATGGTVYDGSDDGTVYALDAATGHLRWTYTSVGAIGSSPAATGGTVYVGSVDGAVYALDART